jgi:type IV pilus assembly protein PilQ
MLIPPSRNASELPGWLFCLLILFFSFGPLGAISQGGDDALLLPIGVSWGLCAEEQSQTPPASKIADSLSLSQKVTLDFNDADIRNVLKILSYKSGVNIVTTPEVIGNVSIRLVDVPWEKALEVILSNYGFGYEKRGNVIMVAPIDKLTNQKKQEVELAQVQPTATEVFTLKYIDAQDAKKALEPQLSPRGKITVLEMTGYAGWEFGTVGASGEDLSKRKKAEVTERRSKTLIISDIPPVLDNIKAVIKDIDVMPLQILIETRIMEVNRDKLKDIGFDAATGTSSVESTTLVMTPAGKNKAGADTYQAGGHILGNQITPTVFGPKESTALTTANTGLKLLFKSLTGAQFEVLLHALEEDVHTNTLSAPRIMTLNNQEASILIGTKYPILRTETSDAGTALTSVTLDFYQSIGIQLNVVPQISANGYINMLVHPAVSSYVGTDSSLTSAKYPVIDMREAETRILIKDGETVVIGGLLKDVKSRELVGIPFLSKIPFLGIFFRRETVDTQKIDLLIFITAKIVKEGDFSAEEIAKLEERLERGTKKGKRLPKPRN